MRSDLVPISVQLVVTGIHEVALVAGNFAMEVDCAVNVTLR
jgi:hypothetical protein